MATHRRVKAVVEATQELIDDAAGKISSDTNFVLLPEGFYVRKSLADLCHEVRRIFPGCKFGSSITRSRSSPCRDLNLYARCNVSVYYPNDTYAMGDIGYDDYSQNNSGHKYFVYSRTITNQKFRRDNEGYHMKTSEDMSVLLREIKKSLRPYKVHEIAERHDEFRRDVRDEVHNAEMNESRTRDAVISFKSGILKELKALVESGHQFINPGFGELCANWISAREEIEKERSRPVPAVFITVSTLRDKQVFDVLKVEDVKQVSRSFQDMPCQRYGEADLPEEYVGKLSVLSLLQDGTYSPRVGRRVDERTYWLEL
jgi:hypothetical protein